VNRSRRARRALAAARAGCGLIVAGSLLGGGPADAQSPSLGGFSGSASAAAVHVLYSPQGLLPTGPPVDFGAPDALATIASGPATFARASVADPGDLLANPGALLALASPNYPAGLIPPYPFRITASSGVGQPSAESNPAPGLNARVVADASSSHSQATMPAINAPSLVTIGSMSANADTQTDGTTVTVHARSVAEGIDIAGVIHIESVVTDVTATSAGGDTTLDGGTTVTGATIAGSPVAIDDEGVRGAIGGVDVNQVLQVLGITITLPGPAQLDEGATGQLASAGLRIDIVESASTVPGLTDILDALPPLDSPIPGAPSPEDLIAAIRARHLTVIEIGRGVVSLTARTPAPRVTTPPATTGGPPAPAVVPSGSPAAPVRPAPTAPPAAPVAPVASAPAVADVAPALPVASVATGVGALAALLVLLSPFVGEGFARIAAAQLATDQEGCPWERR
jgi:hypothetical protein